MVDIIEAAAAVFPVLKLPSEFAESSEPKVCGAIPAVRDCGVWLSPEGDTLTPVVTRNCGSPAGTSVRVTVRLKVVLTVVVPSLAVT